MKLRLFLYFDTLGHVHVHRGCSYINLNGERVTQGANVADTWLGTFVSWKAALDGLPVDFPWSIRLT